MRMLLAIALTAASSWAMARPLPESPPAYRPQPATLQVTGRAQVSASPDRVYIDMGVTTRARKPEAAAARNAARLSAVIAAVKRAAGSGAQLTTTEYSITPTYNYPHNGGTPTLVGYTASNVVRVRVDDLRRIGPVIDAATQAGSNDVRGIRFALRDGQASRAEALHDAALNARQDAQALAGALGLRVVRVLSVAEQSPTVVPPVIYPQIRQFAKAEVAPPTPIEAGAIEVSATVTLTVAVAPAKR